MQKKFSLIILFFTCWSVATAQVNIGSNDVPEGFSVLQLTGTGGGLRVNQLDSTAIIALENSINASGKLAAAQGLLVYNTTEGCYNMFRGKTFQSLCATSQAAFSTDSTLICGSLQIFGEYMEGQSLNNGNYLTLDVLCTKAGSYTFAGTVRNEDGANGYAFSKSDVLLEAGRHTLTIYGSGTPVYPGFDSLFISINQNQYRCSSGMISVDAAPERAIFQIVSAKQVGHHFTTNVNYSERPDTNTVEVTIRVPLNQGGLQTELTAHINGLDFKYTPEEGSFWEGPEGYLNTVYYCNGTPTDAPDDCDPNLLSSEQEAVGDTTAREYRIVLNCTGNPVTYGWHAGSVKGLSGKIGRMVYSPPVNLLFLSRTIRILGVGDDLYNIADSTTNHNLAWTMLREPGNYIYKDSLNPGQYIENFKFTKNYNNQPAETFINNADIIYFGYPRHSGDYATLVNFVKNKHGVLLFAGEGSLTSDINMIKAITGETVTMSNTGGAGMVSSFIDVPNDPIFNNSRFGPLEGKHWGGDGGGNNSITSTTPSRFVVYSRHSGTGGANCFRDNQLGFIYIGDGGFASGMIGSNYSNSDPFNIDGTTKLPAPQTRYSPPVWNSLFIANSVWWAIDFLRKNGKID